MRYKLNKTKQKNFIKIHIFRDSSLKFNHRIYYNQVFLYIINTNYFVSFSFLKKNIVIYYVGVRMSIWVSSWLFHEHVLCSTPELQKIIILEVIPVLLLSGKQSDNMLYF